MKKIFILFLTVTLILGIFISCDKASHNDTSDTTDDIPSEQTSKETTADATTDTSEETTEETSTEVITTEFNPEDHGYTIEKVNEEYYIKFLFSLPSSNQMIDYPSISSLQDFYNMLHKKTLIPNNALAHIRLRFEEDNIGYKILDIDNIYRPILPEGITFNRSDMPVYWMQYTYCFSLNYDRVLQSYGINDGTLSIMTRYEDYMGRYNNEIYDNATVLTEGDKVARVTVQFYEDDYEAYYEYRVLLKSGDVYAEIQLAARQPVIDNSIFLDFDFEKYEG